MYNICTWSCTIYAHDRALVHYSTWIAFSRGCWYGAFWGLLAWLEQKKKFPYSIKNFPHKKSVNWRHCLKPTRVHLQLKIHCNSRQGESIHLQRCPLSHTYCIGSASQPCNAMVYICCTRCTHLVHLAEFHWVQAIAVVYILNISSPFMRTPSYPIS